MIKFQSCVACESSCCSFLFAVGKMLYECFEQIPTIKKSISSGNKVPEVQITTLIEMLMRQAIKLDSISTINTELSAAKNLQVTLLPTF